MENISIMKYEEKLLLNLTFLNNFHKFNEKYRDYNYSIDAIYQILFIKFILTKYFELKFYPNDIIHKILWKFIYLKIYPDNFCFCLKDDCYKIWIKLIISKKGFIFEDKQQLLFHCHKLQSCNNKIHFTYIKYNITLNECCIEM